MSVKKKPIVTPRKSSRLASTGKCLVVSLDDASSTHTSLEPKPTTSPSPKPATPPTHHIPSPPVSLIPSTPPQTATTPPSPLSRTSPSLGFADFSNASSGPAALLDPVLNKLQDLQSQFYSFQDEVRVTFASITDLLIQMEARLGPRLDTLEVQTEFVDEQEPVA